MDPAAIGLPLARGGVLFSTSAGWIQYGVVPETIKDTMVLPGGVPAIFVVPPNLFCTERGVSFAELEFPCYYNFFIKSRRATLVCRPHQRAILEHVLGEAVFGPSRIDPAEFSATGACQGTDIAGEMAYFRRNPKRNGAPMELHDLVAFEEFDARGVARLPSGVSVVAEDDGGISILEAGRAVARWRGDPPIPARIEGTETALKTFKPPLLGVSVIGSGHGFDPGNRTSGFIIWVEGRGVMVDPPVDSWEWLQGYDLSAREIDSLILTHCHADHDAGTLQRILLEGRISIYTTPTVLSSFVAKYAPLLDMTPETFRGLFDYVPVQPERTMSLHGGEATFRYSLHSIPCVGFEVKLRGRSLVYPSDTLNDPKQIQKLHEQGVLPAVRRDALVNFPWHHNLVLHEAGIPPIHTSINYLATLQEEMKSKMLLVHVSQKTLPPGSGLRVAPTGLENTVDLGAAYLPVNDALKVLDALAGMEILSELPISRAGEFLRMAHMQVYNTGDRIVEKGTHGEHFYIILSGHASVSIDGREIKSYSTFDFFGETALILNQPRSADVIAKTRVEVLFVNRTDFLHFVRGTDVTERLMQLARLRMLPTWELMAASPVLASFTSNQKTHLQTLMEPATLAPGEQVGADPLLLAEGTLGVWGENERLAVIEEGGFAGDVGRLRKGEQSPFTFKAEKMVRGFRFDHVRLLKFLAENPGAFLHLAGVTVPWEATLRLRERTAEERAMERPEA
ncbi:MAG: cyclic nucleotide-binding domain-containing protein [Planctomycetes bacterium]|nr:cyclic nucleotide-binding domain-containing protein [Planctomycetota bacterium]